MCLEGREIERCEKMVNNFNFSSKQHYLPVFECERPTRVFIRGVTILFFTGSGFKRLKIRLWIQARNHNTSSLYMLR